MLCQVVGSNLKKMPFPLKNALLKNWLQIPVVIYILELHMVIAYCPCQEFLVWLTGDPSNWFPGINFLSTAFLEGKGSVEKLVPKNIY